MKFKLLGVLALANSVINNTAAQLNIAASHLKQVGTALPLIVLGFAYTSGHAAIVYSFKQYIPAMYDETMGTTSPVEDLHFDFEADDFITNDFAPSSIPANCRWINGWVNTTCDSITFLPNSMPRLTHQPLDAVQIVIGQYEMTYYFAPGSFRTIGTHYDVVSGWKYTSLTVSSTVPEPDAPLLAISGLCVALGVRGKLRKRAN